MRAAPRTAAIVAGTQSVKCHTPLLKLLLMKIPRGDANKTDWYSGIPIINEIKTGRASFRDVVSGMNSIGVI